MNRTEYYLPLSYMYIQYNIRIYDTNTIMYLLNRSHTHTHARTKAHAHEKKKRIKFNNNVHV